MPSLLDHQQQPGDPTTTSSNSNYVLSQDDDDDGDQQQPTSAVRQNASTLLGKPVISITHMPGAEPFFLPRPLHERAGALVHNQLFQKTMIALIVLNSLITAIGTIDMEESIEQAFDTADTVLLCIFTAELGLHILYYGPELFHDGWLTFDFVLVTCSWAFQAMTVLRAFRIVRAVRVVSKVKDLRELVMALFHTVDRMGAIASLLLLIYFVFTIFFTELFKDAYAKGVTSEDHFSTLGLTAFTLLQFMFLDDWSSMTKELMAEYWWSWIPILVFIIICTFVVMNLIIAVICDAVGAIQTDEMTANLDVMQRATEAAISLAETKQREEIRRLETKVDQLMTLLQQQKGMS
mmetsp:Transcript_22353/g.52607  ORF Transcript_22353/g.52607 Transcript_22353/m.52607 type:complete len:350 (+) Transcript_22353:115-1164(+)